MSNAQGLENLKNRLTELRQKVCKDPTISAHILDQYIKEMMELNTKIQSIEKEVASYDPSNHTS